jgi:hypothetical protein
MKPTCNLLYRILYYLSSNSGVEMNSSPGNAVVSFEVSCGMEAGLQMNYEAHFL